MHHKCIRSIAISSVILALAPAVHGAVLYTVTEISSAPSSATPAVTNCGIAINSNGQVIVQSTFRGVTLSAVTAEGIYTDVKQPPTQSYTSTYFTAINNLGYVVGNTDSPAHAFLSNTKKLTLLNSANHVFGINDKNQVVGMTTVNGNSHAFVTVNKAMKIKDLGTLGGKTSYASDINNKGQVVGSVTTAGGDTHAFMTVNDIMTDLGTLPGAYSSNAYAINDRGQVVGASAFPTLTPTSHAFIVSKGVMTDLGTLNGTSNYSSSMAFDVNSKGQVVGTDSYSVTHGVPQAAPDVRAFVTFKGKIRDLNRLIPANSKWKLTRANAINDKGQITGCGINPTGGNGAFLLTPVK